MQKKNQTITIQVTAEDKKMAQKLARLECRSVSGYLRQLLHQEIRRRGGGASQTIKKDAVKPHSVLLL